MNDLAKGIVVFFFILLGIFVLSFASLEAYKYFNPRYQQADTNTFYQGKAYTGGMKMRLDTLYQQYHNEDTEGKAATKAVVEHEFSDLPNDAEAKLPAYLQKFLNDMRTQ
jgi:hypothetical protein